MITNTIVTTINDVEELLGNNLVGLADALDLEVRQGNKIVIQRLIEINEAWRLITVLQRGLKQAEQSEKDKES